MTENHISHEPQSQATRPGGGLLVDVAIETALTVHAGQRRKGGLIPYAVHSLAVGMILAASGCSEELIAAGILHDTLEDTPLTVADIKSRFGDRVASLVEACSEPDKSLPWEERKAGFIASLKNASLDVRVIVCADKLHNLRTMVRDYDALGDALWSRFSRGKREQAWYFGKLAEVLSERSDQGRYGRLFQGLSEEVRTFFRSSSDREPV